MLVTKVWSQPLSAIRRCWPGVATDKCVEMEETRRAEQRGESSTCSQERSATTQRDLARRMRFLDGGAGAESAAGVASPGP